MQTRSRAALMFACVAAFAGCDAGDAPHDDAPMETPLVGSYATLRGGTLEIFEPVPGHFLVGELTPQDSPSALVAQPEQGGFAGAPPESLVTTYRMLVGGKVPGEVLAAESRRLRQEPLPTTEAGLEGASASDDTSSLLRNEPRNKAVDRDVSGFRTQYCREGRPAPNTSGCQSFNVCWTEKSGTAEVTKSGVHGVYTSVRPYRGRVTYEVKYDDALRFSRTVDEGKGYSAWKTSSRDPFRVEVRVLGGDSGYHLAVVGTTDVRFYDWYGDEANAQGRHGCSYTQTPTRLPGDLGPATAGPPPKGAVLGAN